MIKTEKDHSKFAKSLLLSIYGPRRIMTRCADVSRLRTTVIPGIEDSPVKTYTPQKYAVIKSKKVLFYKFEKYYSSV